MLTRAGCEERQRRLLKLMEQNRWDLFVTSNYRTVYYLTGTLGAGGSPALFAIWGDGSSLLVTTVKEGGLASQLVLVETYSIQRTITEPHHDAAKLFSDALSARSGVAVSQYAVERAKTSGLVESALRNIWPGAALCDASAGVLQLRKKKEEDEIGEIRGSLRLCAVAYKKAREVIAEGLTEIDVFNAMQAAIVQEAGTSVALKGDFACGERGITEGGAPTPRKILAHDLYILDIFPAPALYFGDTCRAFSVGHPTDLQQRAWEVVRESVRLGEAAVRPGVRARDVYATVKEFLDSHEFTERSFFHHAGHGIGHDGHEAPRIIPGTEDVFEVGDVITLEPGVYTKALQGGIRLEDNYVVRENGLENLFDFPMEL
jgi:Xaa-Pro aminopeptidase